MQYKQCREEREKIFNKIRELSRIRFGKKMSREKSNDITKQLKKYKTLYNFYSMCLRRGGIKWRLRVNW